MRDMTNGSPLKHLIKYAVPLLLGNWFQMGYNAVDSVIVGRFIGKDALAAVGIASPVMNLVILAITGLCLGAGVLMSEFFGAKDWSKLKSQFSTTILSGTILSMVVTLLGLLFTVPLLKVLEVPGEIMGITTTYLRIIFLGMPFAFFYNALAAALKSVGDAKTPLKFLMFSSILNGVLDVIFIGLLGCGIVCSAITTVVSEAVSAILACRYLMKKMPQLCPQKGEWRINRTYLAKTIQYGGVTALQQAVQPLGKLLIQGQVNMLGVDVIAAFNAVTRVDDFVLQPEQSIALAITTYVAQNRGAGKPERIKKGFAAGMRLEVGYWMVLGAVTFLLKEPIVALFVTGKGSNRVIEIGAEYLAWMSLFYLWPAMTNGVQGFFRGLGRLKLTLLGTFIQTSLRVVVTVLLAESLGIIGIAFGCMVGWSVMLLVEVPILIKTLYQDNL